MAVGVICVLMRSVVFDQHASVRKRQGGTYLFEAVGLAAAATLLTSANDLIPDKNEPEEVAVPERSMPMAWSEADLSRSKKLMDSIQEALEQRTRDPTKMTTGQRRLSTLADSLKDESTKLSMTPSAAISKVTDLLELNHIKGPKALSEVMKSPGELAIPVQSADGSSHLERMAVSPKLYAALRNLVKEQMPDTDEASEKSKIVSWLVRMSHQNATIKKWIHQQLERSHPLWRSQNGSVNRELLSDEWGVVEVAGAGEVPYLKEYEEFVPVVKDYLFALKRRQDGPVDARQTEGEFNLQDHPSRFVLLLNFAQTWWKRNVLLVRPCDDESQNAFDSDKDHAGTAATFSADQREAGEGEFDMPLELAQLFTFASTEDERRTPLSKSEVTFLFAQAPAIRPAWQSAYESAKSVAYQAARP